MKLRRILLFVAAGFGVLVALVAGAAVALDSAAGKRFLVATLNDALAADGLALTAERVDGSLWGLLSVGRVVLSDEAGVLIEADDLRLAWSPGRLFGGELHVASVEAAALTVARLPEGGADAPDDTDGGLLPGLPVDLVVERLAVERLSLGASLPGGPAELTLMAAATLIEGRRFGLQIAARRTDGEGMAANADIALDLDANLLRAHAQVDAAAGSAIHGLLGLDDAPALALTLDGDGPLDDWQGRLVVNGGGGLAADLALSVAGSEPWRIRADGPVTATALLPEAWRFVAAPSLALSFDAQVGRDAALAIDALAVAGPALALDIAGQRAADGTLDFAVAATAQDGAGWAEVAAPARFGALRLDGTLSGSEAAPQFDGTLVVDRPSLGGTDADTLTVGFDTGIDDDTLRFDATGTFAGLAVDPRYAAGTGDAPGFELRGGYDMEDGAIDLERAHVAFASLVLDANGTVLPDPLSADLAVTGEAADLSVLTPLAGMGIAGRATMQALVDTDGDRVTATLAIAGTDLSFGDATLDALLGGDAELVADATLAGDGRLDLSTLSLSTAALALDGGGSVDTRRETLALDYTLTMPSVAPLAPELAGQLRAEGTLTGPLADPATETTAEIESLAVDGTAVGDVRIAADLATLASGAAGPVEASGGSPAGPFRLGLTLHQEAEHIRFDAVDLRIGRHSRIAGAAALATATGLVDGRLEANIDTLAPYGELAGVPLGGSFAGTVALAPESGNQSVAIAGAADALSVGDTSADRVAIDLAATLGDGAPILAGTVEASGIVAEPATLDTLALTVDGTTEGFEGRLRASGDLDGPLELAGGFSLSADADGAMRLDIATLDGTALGETLALQRPATFLVAGENLTLENLDLVFGPATLRGDARIAPDAVAAQLAANDLPAAWIGSLGDLGQDPVGTIDVALNLSGTAADPVAVLGVDIEGLAARAPRFRDEGSMNGRIDARFAGGQLAIDSEWTGLGDNPLVIAAALPFDLSLQPFAAGLRPGGALQGRAQWRGDVRLLLAIVPIDPHRLEGMAAFDLALGGTAGDPRINGEATLAGGTYENLSTGTLLRDLDLSVTASGRNDLAFDLTATDGGRGTVAAQGTIAVDPALAMPFDVTANFENAVLVRRDEVHAMATGDVRLVGDTEHATLTGEIAADRIDARLDAGLPPSVTALPVTEINVPADRIEEEEPVDPGVPMAIDLDLRLRIPNQAYVAGRGLDSEWQGNLHVTGTADAPRIVGELTPRHGSFTFADRRFDIADSRILFDGAVPVDPRLDISAVSKASDIEAIVRVTGPASDPEIAITSSPPLPQDEVLSRLLFGRKAGELSPVQALQLAQALRTLSGQGGGAGGIVDFVRKTVGVDVLTVGSDAEGGTSLEVGQYVTERVRVGVAQRFETGGTAGTVEIELTDDISIETEVGGEASRVGVSWGYDY